MTAPVLSRPLVLEARSQVSDGAGGYTDAWTALGTLWAEVAPRSGREARGTGLPVSRVLYRVTLRAARPGAPDRPRAGQRFRDGDRLFDILAVAEADRHGRYLACTCSEETLA